MYNGKDKEMYISNSKNQRTIMTDETLTDAKNVFVDLATILDDVISGKNSMSDACKQRGYDCTVVRRLMMTTSFKNIKLDQPPMPIDEALPPEIDSYENFYMVIFNPAGLPDLSNIILPPDYKETVEYVISETGLDDIEQQVLRYRYALGDEEEMTFSHMTLLFNKSETRLCQIRDKALRKIRHHSRSEILRKGKKQYLTDKEAVDKALKDYKESILHPSKDAAAKMGKFNKETMPLKNQSIDMLELSARPCKCLHCYGIHTIGQLAAIEEVNELYKIRNLGHRSVEEIFRKCEGLEAEYELSSEPVHFKFLHTDITK